MWHRCSSLPGTEDDIAAKSAPGQVPEQATRATYRDVFAIPEFRALWSAQLASVAGDQLARVALTVLVYARTASALLAAVTFMLSVVPVFIGGITLAGLADRFERRRVMIACDLFRCALVLVMALPRVPLALLVVLLAVVTLVGAPFTAARAAMYPDLLPGEKYVAGTAVTLTTNQFAQVLGFAAGGGVVALLGTQTSLVIDAATFALSAAIVRCLVRRRPAPAARHAAEHGAEPAGSARAGARAEPAGRHAAHAGAGFADAARMVFRTPAMLLPMLFGWLAAFYNAPEGVAAPLARGLGGGAAAVGAILAAQAFGETAGMLAFGRLVRPATRLRVMGPLAVATCAVLVFFVLKPALPVTLVILAVSGAFGAYQIAANAAFVSAVPGAWRARAFGLAQGGMSLGQGTVMVVAGAAAQHWVPATVVAVIGAVGAVCAACVAASWNRSRKADAPGGSRLQAVRSGRVPRPT
jgi:predicted MFS family arabinose efflux permease